MALNSILGRASAPYVQHLAPHRQVPSLVFLAKVERDVLTPHQVEGLSILANGGQIFVVLARVEGTGPVLHEVDSPIRRVRRCLIELLRRLLVSFEAHRLGITLLDRVDLVNYLEHVLFS